MGATDDLSFFTLLARHVSLAAAAAELGLSPPAVSRRLSALERRLGVRLLNRTTRRLSLTPEGERYLADGEGILRDIEALERSLAASRDEPRGLLRINATFGFGRRHLAPMISAFAKSHPQVQVLLELTDKPLDLTAHAMDLGIRFGPPPDARVLARRIVANRRLLCAAPSYLARCGVPRVPTDLLQHDCIVIRENLRAYNHWSLTQTQDPGLTTLVKVHGPLSTNHGEVAVEWAVAGHGILLRSEWDVASLLREGHLQQVLPDWVDASADIHAVYPQRHHLSAKVRVFIDELVTWFDQAC
jgi:LysR family transcriptional regulator, transcriptional activator for dmlA